LGGGFGATLRGDGALVSRGQVWWVDDPVAGRRPHLVLSRAAAVPVLNAVIAVPATRTIRSIVTEVPLGPDDGMPEPCVLSLDNTTLVPKQYFAEPICTLGEAAMASVCRALGYATGCR
jgi:mRNA interferase MazF